MLLRLSRGLHEDGASSSRFLAVRRYAAPAQRGTGSAYIRVCSDGSGYSARCSSSVASLDGIRMLPWTLAAGCETWDFGQYELAFIENAIYTDVGKDG